MENSFIRIHSVQDIKDQWWKIPYLVSNIKIKFELWPRMTNYLNQLLKTLWNIERYLDSKCKFEHYISKGDDYLKEEII